MAAECLRLSCKVPSKLNYELPVNIKTHLFLGRHLAPNWFNLNRRDMGASKYLSKPRKKTWTRRGLLIICLAVSGVSLVLFNWLNLQISRPGYQKTKSTNEHIYDEVGVGMFPCDAATIRLIKTQIRGASLCPREGGFLESIAIFNDRHKYEHIPGIVIRPVDTADVAAALELAQQLGLQVTVKNGGHNPAGLCRQLGAMLVDMSSMKRLKFDKKTMTIMSEAGALWSGAQDLIKDENVAFVGGGCPSVGIAGLVLGGGIGWLSRSRGLASDNVVSMELVLKNGTVVTASAEENPELFWALRGAGGSNFGVVTKLSFRVFPSEKEFFAGDATLRTEDPRVFRELMEGFLYGVEKLEDNGPSMWMVLTKARIVGKKHAGNISGNRFHYLLFHDGRADQGPRAAAPVLERLGPVFGKHHEILCAKSDLQICRISQNESRADRVANWLVSGEPFIRNHSFVSWSASMGATHAYMYWKSGFVEDITPELIDAALDALDEVPDLEDADGQGTAFFQFQVEHLGGAIADFPHDYSAFSHRSAQLLWSIQVFMGPTAHVTDSTDKMIGDWSASAFAKLEPFFKGSYSNYADPDLATRDWQHRYYGENYERLQDIKRASGGFGMFDGRQKIGHPLMNPTT